ncbi:hypothetical protein COEREDRAFT_11021 [Coemansia reversa NRRL 1564]|uniref:Retrotransposon gag domain-containing protein n=1 Tax=Coemansia reversa (strain ATCC 12441 / NRRL 1564) TaxID=763665 RepID=A0A2G5B4B7_COERN|nr:hypothetical protein COEREDRAFT_11021 [Coemansia reversa NRRL 1564]|eukprot:PIA13849.1 hypothetical protein COEREDRAFT_11021 [Coemansia reversa NRRL 1564]
MSENTGREAAQFAQSVRGHLRFNGNALTITVDGFKEIVESVFRAQSITDPVRQAVLAEGILGTAMMAQLIAFLTESYDSISSAFQGWDELQMLTFAIADDLPSFNQKFDHLVARSELPATPASVMLNQYRRAMPMEIKKELFASDIGTVQQAKTRALVIWRTRRSLQDKPVDNDRPVPMEVDWADNRFVRHRGPRYNARNFPCSEAEFELRLKANQCLYCRGSNHRYSRCHFRNDNSGKQVVQTREIVTEEQTLNVDTNQGNAQ